MEIAGSFLLDSYYGEMRVVSENLNNGEYEKLKMTQKAPLFQGAFAIGITKISPFEQFPNGLTDSFLFQLFADVSAGFFRRHTE